VILGQDHPIANWAELLAAHEYVDDFAGSDGRLLGQAREAYFSQSANSFGGRPNTSVRRIIFRLDVFL
jgi:hypothetical protein